MAPKDQSQKRPGFLHVFSYHVDIRRGSRYISVNDTPPFILYLFFIYFSFFFLWVEFPYAEASETRRERWSKASIFMYCFVFPFKFTILLPSYLSSSYGLGKRMQQITTVQKWPTKSMPSFICGVIFLEPCRINPSCFCRSRSVFHLQSMVGILGRKSAVVVVDLLWPFQVFKALDLSNLLLSFILFLNFGGWISFLDLGFLDSGKLITWGAADEEGQIFLTSGKHGVMWMFEWKSLFHFVFICLVLELIWNLLRAATLLRRFPRRFLFQLRIWSSRLLPVGLIVSQLQVLFHSMLQSKFLREGISDEFLFSRRWCYVDDMMDSSILVLPIERTFLCLRSYGKCTEAGEVYTWGWSECIPSMKTLRDLAIGGGLLKDSTGKQSLTTAEQGNINVYVEETIESLFSIVSFMFDWR